MDLSNGDIVLIKTYSVDHIDYRNPGRAELKIEMVGQILEVNIVPDKYSPEPGRNYNFMWKHSCLYFFRDELELVFNV